MKHDRVHGRVTALRAVIAARLPERVCAVAVNRRILLASGLVAVGASVMLNSNSLIAAGIAPTLLGIVPCLVMCGLGLCMSKCARSSSGDLSGGQAERNGAADAMLRSDAPQIPSNQGSPTHV
jgi:hypothetical protein